MKRLGDLTDDERESCLKVAPFVGSTSSQVGVNWRYDY
jgi:hypothetical protein